MGDVFESMMPEEHYQNEIMETQIRLKLAYELLLKSAEFLEFYGESAFNDEIHEFLKNLEHAGYK